MSARAANLNYIGRCNSQRRMELREEILKFKFCNDFFTTTMCIGSVDTYCTNCTYIIMQYISFHWVCARTHCICNKHPYCFASQRMMCKSGWINAFIALDEIYSTQLWRRLQTSPTENSSSSMVKRDACRATSTILLYSGRGFLKTFS